MFKLVAIISLLVVVRGSTVTRQFLPYTHQHSLQVAARAPPRELGVASVANHAVQPTVDDGPLIMCDQIRHTETAEQKYHEYLIPAVVAEAAVTQNTIGSSAQADDGLVCDRAVIAPGSRDAQDLCNGLPVQVVLPAAPSSTRCICQTIIVGSAQYRSCNCDSARGFPS